MGTVRDYRRIYRSRSGRPINAPGSGQKAYVLLRVHRRSKTSIAERYSQAEPTVTQLGDGLAYSAPLLMEKRAHVEGSFSF
jgi:hypothetical protein